MIIPAVTLSAALLFPGHSFADESDPKFIAAYNTEYGLKLLSEGKYDLAVERFVKSLLTDPENTAARDSLKEIAETRAVSEANSGLKILRFLDQLDYVRFLQGRYRNMAEENVRLREFLQRQPLLTPDLKAESDRLDGQAREWLQQFPRIGVPEGPADDQRVDLPRLIARLAQKKEELLKQVSFWEDQNNRLRAVRRAALEQGAIGAAAKKADETRGRLLDKDKLLEAQRRNTEYFRKELATVRDDFSALQDRLKNTDEKILDLTKKLAEMSMDLFEKNKQLTAKDNHAAALEQELSEAREKMNLVQRIIQEKDDRIALLEQDIGRIQSQMAAGPMLEGVSQIKTDLKDFQESIKAEMEKNRDKVVDLQTRLTQLSANYEALARTVQVKDAEISLLNSSLKNKELAVSQYRQAFLSNTERLSQMDGIVELYRGKLIDAQAVLRQKNEELIRLQATLSQEGPPSNSAPAVEHDLLDGRSPFDLTFSKTSSAPTMLLEK